MYRNRLNRAMEVTSRAAGINQESIQMRQKRIVQATGSWGTDQVDAEVKKESKIMADMLKNMKDNLFEAGKQAIFAYFNASCVAPLYMISKSAANDKFPRI